MINLSYKYSKNSSSLEIEGMPDVSNGDLDNNIGIILSWTLKIIGFPLLEGKKEHLDDLIEVICHYSRSYISGIRKKFISKKNIISLSPSGEKHKLILISSQKDVKPLEIIIDDSELSDLTCCIDLLRFDKRINIKWNYENERPYSKGYLKSIQREQKNNYLNPFYAIIIFTITSGLLFLIPIENNKVIESDKINVIPNELTK